MLIVTTLAKFEAFTQFFWGKNFYLQTKLFLFMYCTRVYIYAEVSDEHSKSVKHGFMSNFSNNHIYIYRTCNSVL